MVENRVGQLSSRGREGAAGVNTDKAGRAAGSQVWLLIPLNSLSSLLTNNLSIYFIFGTTWSVIPV